MKRREQQPMTKHTLNLFAGHFERLQSLYPRVGAAFVIRRLVEGHLAEKEEAAATAVPAPELNIAVEDIL